MSEERAVGYLGTSLTMDDATKIVIARQVDKPSDSNQIVYVLGQNEDYVLICDGFLGRPMSFQRKGIDRFLSNHNKKNLPVFTCDVHTCGENITTYHAFFDATEVWVMSETTEEVQTEEVPADEEEKEVYTVRFKGYARMPWVGKVIVPKGTSSEEVRQVLDEEMFNRDEDEIDEVLGSLDPDWINWAGAICYLHGWELKPLDIDVDLEVTC